MNSATRKHSLAILMFYRAVVYDQLLWRRLRTIIDLILRNKNLESLKFIYRFFKLYQSKKLN